MNKKIMLIPSYVKNFQCIAQDCEDSCCIGWRIHIDKDTYKKYKEINNKDLKKKFKKHIRKNRHSINKNDYAEIILTEDKKCPFLNENKLCEIYIKCGESKLSKTCTSYPRVYNKVNNIIEKSLTLSCPYATKLALLNNKPMEFDEIETDEQLLNINREINTNITTKPLNKYFWDLRIFTISLIQNRNYSLDERLIILGLFYKKLNQILKEKKYEEILVNIKIYNERLSKGQYIGFINNIESNYNIKISFLKQIIEFNKNNKILKGYYNKILKKLNLNSCTKDEELIRNYKLCYEKYYKPFENKHSYILENFLVNYIFQTLFPYTNKNNLFDEYAKVIVFYSIIKMYLIGISSYYKDKFSIDVVLKCIQSVSKSIIHNAIYSDYIYKELIKNNLINMAVMSILIKN